MITTAELIDTIRRGNGETARQTEARIAGVAAREGLAPVDGQWDDDDASIISDIIAGVSWPSN